LIEALQTRGELSETISDELLTSLHELASELQPVELNLSELAQALLKQGSALTVTDLRTALDSYLNTRLKGYNSDLVRIKIVLEHEP
jgi:hypothetical protein